MYSDRQLEKHLLQSKSQQPLQSVFRNLLYSFGSAFLAVVIIFIIQINISWWLTLVIIMTSGSFFFFGWGAERLWYASISKMLENPFSKFSFITRIPFWFISGGIGLSFPVLFAYKYGLIYISLVSQSDLFIWGGIVGCLMQIPLQINIMISLIRQTNTY
jgi:hypothetical protein